MPAARGTATLLAVWLGAGLLFTLAVAPAAFAVLPTRALAGALVGRVLPVLFWSGAVVGLVALVEAARRPERRGLAVFMAALLVATSLVAQLAVAPRIRELRERIGPAIEALDATDARRIAFGRLHGVSVGLLGAGMLAALTILARDLWSRRS